jgi:hypothetical protein
MEFTKSSDDEILTQLENARLAAVLEDSDEWKLVHETMKRTWEKHVHLLINEDPQNEDRMRELQHICKLYGDKFLPQLIKNFRAIGTFAFEEAKTRGWFEEFKARLMGFAKNPYE